MSVNVSVFFTLCSMVELKEKQLLLSEVFCRRFASRSADCTVGACICRAGLSRCIYVHISPATGRSWSLSAPFKTSPSGV